jgi:dTMP kinase
MSGYFITIEGIDGSGKTTQARLLAEWLRGQGYEVCATREPGGTPAGQRIRELVLSPDYPIPPAAELFLYLADRAAHVAEVLQPALGAGQVVVCERYADSTFAYQGYGRGLDLDYLRQLNETATGGLTPDLTIILDLSVQQARMDHSRLDRLEAGGVDFLNRVAEGFRELARQEPARIVLVDALGTIEQIQAAIIAQVQQTLGARK